MASDALDIELAVYSCFEGALLFVPSPCRPPRDAEALFGPLAGVGTVTVCLDDERWASILSQIERHLFATVPRPQGLMLVGDDLRAVAPEPDEA
jgi:hypothetical protein